MHVVLPSTEYVPAGHVAGAMAGFAQLDPAGHVAHEDAPATAAKVPAGHVVHEVASAILNVPAGHCTGSTDVVAQLEPAGHDEQVPDADNA